jgi:hypothetical protein
MDAYLSTPKNTGVGKVTLEIERRYPTLRSTAATWRPAASLFNLRFYAEHPAPDTERSEQHKR